MRTAVVDASVAVKWVVRQPLTDAAYRAIEQFRLIAPSLILAEIGNALWKYCRTGEIGAASLPEIMNGLETRYFKTDPIDEAMSATALALAVDLDHPIYDCYYLAMAKRESVPIISEDRRLTQKARLAGFTVVALADIPESAQ
ncbi:MAG: type II toxin-antitoxin system VapC family toxin [Parvularculaceae bacterium]